MPPLVRVRLFGRFSISLASSELLTRAPKKARELLAFLFLHPGRPHTRESLSARLWPDFDEAKCRKHFRQTLWQIHRILTVLGKKRADQLLRVEPGWLRLEPDRYVWTDVAVLRSALERARSPSPPDLLSETPARIRSILDLYPGDLLEGEAFEWCAVERDFYRDAFLALIDRLVGELEATGNLASGIELAGRALERDPAREQSHRALMRFLHAAGDRTGALRQYERCVVALRRELGAPPDPETVTLMREIRSGRASQAGNPATKRSIPIGRPQRTGRRGRG